MTTTHSRAESLTLTAVAATMQAADLEVPVAACCGTCRWWQPSRVHWDTGVMHCEIADPDNKDAMAYPFYSDFTIELITKHDFACNQWQAKE